MDRKRIRSKYIKNKSYKYLNNEAVILGVKNMKYSVEIHEKYTDYTHGDLINVVGIFNTEKEAWECLHKNEAIISENEVIDVYSI